MDIFEEAAIEKIRFKTDKGLLSTENLIDLPLTGKTVCLDNLACGLYRKLKEQEENSFVIKTNKNRATRILELKFEIVKHIIDKKLLAAQEKEKRKVTSDKKELLGRLIEEKENETLKNTNIEDLKKMYSEL